MCSIETVAEQVQGLRADLAKPGSLQRSVVAEFPLPSLAIQLVLALFIAGVVRSSSQEVPLGRPVVLGQLVDFAVGSSPSKSPKQLGATSGKGSVNTTV